MKKFFVQHISSLTKGTRYEAAFYHPFLYEAEDFDALVEQLTTKPQVVNHERVTYMIYEVAMTEQITIVTTTQKITTVEC